ncbi:MULTISPECIES: GTP-binding protein [unclassified Clostridium]|uniref:GTP-binding protein n=1 Tax=unclassified Clostridium TaxID=2614128 RepID=UPI0025B977BF|nr:MULTISPECIES: GTP-binding protein [unclassified Clostridium]
MTIKVDIFSGFLGAGKTMLIKKLVSESLYKEKIVIIENEFGEVGIDGTILRKANIEVKEINAGCICCNISGDFKKALVEVCSKFNPNRVIIEPSGVGKLSEIISIINSKELKNIAKINMIITVIDVFKYKMYVENFGKVYKDQIQNGRTLVLSRTGQAEENLINSILKGINTINPKATIITTPWEKLRGERIVEISEKTIENNLKEIDLITKPTKGIKAINKNFHSAYDTFESFGTITARKFRESELLSLLKKLDDENYGQVLRAKGILELENNKWIQFDYVPEELQIRNTTPDFSGRLCIIGANLKKENLKKLFKL